MLKLSLRWPLELVLSCAIGTLVACGGQAPGDDDLVGEGAAYLTTTDIVEDGDPAADDAASAGASDGDIDGVAEESSDGMAPAAETCDFGAARSRVRAAFDADGDGRLDPGERAALIAELEDHRRANRIGVLVRRHRHRAFARARWAFDADSNGRIDDAERAELVAAMESRCELRRARQLERHDTNGDGTLDETERAAAREARAQAAEERQRDFLARHDSDGDGQLSREERRAGRRADLRARRDAIAAAYDANGDGTLDETELAALKQAVRERIATGERILRDQS